MYKKYFLSGFILLIVSLVIYFSYNAYAYFFVTPSDSPKGTYNFKINSGEAIADVSKRLEKDKLIPSANSLVFQARLNDVAELQAGDYSLKVPDSPEGISLQIKSQSIAIRDELQKLNSKPVVKLTFKEGETLDQMIAKLGDAGIAQKADLEAVAKDTQKFSITKYPFLPTPLKCTYGDYKTCAKYYLEGYLYPDTYNFVKPTDPVLVFETMLNNFKTKVWSKLEDQVEGKDFFKVVTMASVLEKETGRTKGVTDANQAELSEERKIMAGVFYNRLKLGMKWQSDVTVEYGTGKKLCQQTFTLADCIKLDSPLAQTKYNTYLNIGYPIAPITSPQFDNINAALNPETNDYLFFVSDATGKKYFAKTGTEHFNIINQVDKINKQLGLT